MNNFWLTAASLPIGCKAKIVFHHDFPIHYNTHLAYFKKYVGEVVLVVGHNFSQKHGHLIKVERTEGVKWHMWFYKEELWRHAT